MIALLLALYGGSMVASAATVAAGAARHDRRLRRIGVGLAIVSVPLLIAALIAAAVSS